MDKILKMQSSNLPSITFVDGYNINLIISDMRKLVSLMFTFVLFLGTNAGKAQTALPYEINFADSQEGWTAVDNSPTPGTT